MSSMQLVSCRKWLCWSDESSGTGTITLSMVAGGSILLGSIISSGFPLPPSSATSRLLQSACFGIAARLCVCVWSFTFQRCRTAEFVLKQTAYYVLAGQVQKGCSNCERFCFRQLLVPSGRCCLSSRFCTELFCVVLFVTI